MMMLMIFMVIKFVVINFKRDIKDDDVVDYDYEDEYNDSAMTVMRIIMIKGVDLIATHLLFQV